ncbi:uncharacterized protein TRIADDRAFT_23687, partial [Trichoplax adhaerens]
KNCVLAWKNYLFQAEFSTNMFLLGFFFVRLLGAVDKIAFWVDLNSIVDMLTIPPIIVAALLNSDWQGLKFCRSLIICKIPDTLRYFGILASSERTKVAKMICNITGWWLAAAGAFHLIETNGDPWNVPSNARTISYFESVWYHMVTMSTVGYGDIVPNTILGRVFAMIFIIGGLALFGSYIPLLAEILFSKTKYQGRYIRASEKTHIIVSGCINGDNAKNFLRDFFHKDRVKGNIKVVFLSKNKPSPKMEEVLKKNFASTLYLQGSVLEPEDLDRVAIKEANACIILCDKSCADPERDDAENVMRVIAIKNYMPYMKVIVQINRYKSRSVLQNIPSWRPEKGDAVICLSSLKLGLFAQSCYSPGFSTLMTNILTTRSTNGESAWHSGDWLSQYTNGSAHELYTRKLSAAFHGLSFAVTAEVCYRQLNLLLLAIEFKDPITRERKFYVNPSSKEAIITENTFGYFITDSSRDTRRAFDYCGTCHADILDPKKILKCHCKNASNGLASTSRQYDNQRDSIVKKSMHLLEDAAGCPVRDFAFDSTGMFYWSKKKELEDVILDRDTVYEDMHSHVVICAYGDDNTAPVGLAAIIGPLRTSNIPIDELKTIIILGDIQYIRKDWENICNFHNVYVMHGSPLRRGDIRSVNINLCDMCIVLAIKTKFDIDDPFLEDRESILASLNIKATDFKPIDLPDKEIIGGVFNRPGGVPTKGHQVPMLIDLVNGDNVEFVDDDDDDDPDLEVHLTQPFACGTAFASTVLDSLTSMVYYNRSCLSIIKGLVTGTFTQELERQLAEYSRLQPGSNLSCEFLQSSRDRCRVSQLGLNEMPLAEFAVATCSFGELFSFAMRTYSIMCLGVYRLKNTDPRSLCRKRFVITLPPSRFIVLPSDRIFVLVPF